MAEEKIVVSTQDSGRRLDLFISTTYANLSRSRIQRLLKENEIRVNGEIAKGSYRTKTNDVIEFTIPENKALALQGQAMELEICYQDEDVAVINKPKGLIVHPSTTSSENTLVHGLLAQLDDLSGINGSLRPGIVHRLDKDTSGLLLVAKNDKAHQFLAKQLQDKKMKRYYIALVHGSFDHDYGTIDAPIGRDQQDRKKMTVTAKNSKAAVTHFKVLRRFKDYSLLECELETGRTHQIRVHLQYIKHPLVGDEKYGFRKTLTTQGQMLQAYKLVFFLPKNKQEKTIEIPLTTEFTALLEKLEKENESGY